MARRTSKQTTYGAVAGLVLVAVAAIWWLGGGSESAIRSTSVGELSPPTTAQVAEPVGANPSKSALMVCAPEAAKGIASALGATTINLPTPTWVDHIYSCRYVYPDGVFVVSVKELSNRAETTAYFVSLRSQLGQHERLKRLAQGAFVTNDGSFVLRKDYKVLLVDTTGLPAQFGAPARPRAQVGIDVGVTVLGCWTGA